MIDRARVGHTTESSAHDVDAWRVELFCRAIGETNPVYRDAAAARRAGYPACPVPPTFLKALESEHLGGAALMRLLDVPLRSVLHGEQVFEYDAPVYVGDQVEITRTITNIEDKRDGAMTVIVVESRFSVAGQPAARARQTILARHMPEPAT